MYVGCTRIPLVDLDIVVHNNETIVIMPDELIWNKEEPQPIAVPLLGARVHHNANADQDDYNFVGRDSLISELQSILDETKDSRGCYLIAGFRGSGKTSLINKVLSLHAGKAKHPTWLPTPPSQSNDEICDAPDNHYVIDLLKSGGDKIRRLRGKELQSKSSVDEFVANQDEIEKSFIRSRSNCFTRNCASFYSFIARSFSPLIDVRVNLGHEKSLDPTEVLLNTASLFYKKLQRQPIGTRIVRIIISLASWLPAIGLGIYVGNCWWISIISYLWDWLPHYQIIIVPITPKWVGGILTASILIAGTRYFWTRHLRTYDRVLHRMKQLHERMAFTNEYSSGVSKSGFAFSRKKSTPPITARQIEIELLDLLEDCRKIFRMFVRPNVIFVFDELDKIAPVSKEEIIDSSSAQSVEHDAYQRKRTVDQLLSALKSFITHGEARFFFIAGREMLDSYQGERGSPSSLYETLFNRTFEVPSLLSDHSSHNSHRLHGMIEAFVCRKLMDKDVAIFLWLRHAHQSSGSDKHWKEDLRRKVMYSPFCLRTYYHYLYEVPEVELLEAQRIVLGLRHFIQFLTIHSWGNPKRLVSLFEHFTKPLLDVDWRQSKQVGYIGGPSAKKPRMALQFGVVDQQRIILASNLYTQLYHTLGRQLARSSDKLIVSALAALQYILKYHRQPFSRYHLERMAETLSVYRANELNTLIDSLLSKVLRPQIRLIRNSHYRYRFSSDFEDEMRYISRVSDIESAAFNFTLDASASVKAHYLDQLRSLEKEQKGVSTEGAIGISGVCVILGDLFAQEQADGQAMTYYQKAADVIDRYLPTQRQNHVHIYVEALLRLGEAYERRLRYGRAASVYLRARAIICELQDCTDPVMREAFNSGDSKWDVLRQPFWAYWFLQLKRSPVPMQDKFPKEFEYPFNGGGNDWVNHYKAGQLAFYYGCYGTSVQQYVKAITASASDIDTKPTERSVHRGAYAYLSLGENLFVAMMRSLSNIKLEESGVLGKTIKDFEDNLREFNTLESLDDFVTEFTVGQKFFFEQLEDIRSEEIQFSKIRAVTTFGMMAHAAKMLADYGLYDHAATAYLKILSLWGMLSEFIFSLSLLSEPINKAFSPDLKAVVVSSNSWNKDVRKHADDAITAMNAGGYLRFRKRFFSRDVKLPPQEIQKEQNNDLENDLEIEMLFESNHEINADVPKPKPTFLQHSVTGQKLIFYSVWAHMTKELIVGKKLAPRRIENTWMSPLSTRSLIYAHWLNGRRSLYWLVREKLELELELDALAESNLSDDVYNNNYEQVSDDAAAAVHNFHLAFYYIRQLSGNDQDIMFPLPAMILFDLWHLLHVLVNHRQVKCGGKKASYDQMVKNVEKELGGSKLRRHGAPANCYNLDNVKLRAVAALLGTENLSDISNHGRSEMIKTKSYLADDYEDPHFHLDWSLIQMYGPLARTLRHYVERESNKLKQ